MDSSHPLSTFPTPKPQISPISPIFPIFPYFPTFSLGTAKRSRPNGNPKGKQSAAIFQGKCRPGAVCGAVGSTTRPNISNIMNNESGMNSDESSTINNEFGMILKQSICSKSVGYRINYQISQLSRFSRFSRLSHLSRLSRLSLLSRLPHKKNMRFVRFFTLIRLQCLSLLGILLDII